MKVSILLFFFLILQANALMQIWNYVEQQLEAIIKSAQSADTIEQLNELIWDHRKFNKSDAGIVQRTKETLGQAAMYQTLTLQHIGYLGALVQVRIGDSPEETNWIEMRGNDKSITGNSIYKIEYRKRQDKFFDFFGFNGYCDILCIYKLIFGY